ncbi:Hypothetical protein NTJ_13709 [Nesidiocoris tenuis]|uniref:Histone H2A C-terminal domain-containing protein n=1 Tax=Nesidiocoris tenuis TaxID=355587 RepID=A0ABN7BB60_9HEMI|nr:Hypothetical protein NTJ_13709 [Nesidiocoris tenuis]
MKLTAIHSKSVEVMMESRISRRQGCSALETGGTAHRTRSFHPKAAKDTSPAGHPRGPLLLHLAHRVNFAPPVGSSSMPRGQ